MPGSITTLHERMKVVITHTTTWVKCSACGAELYSILPVEQLSDFTPEQLEKIIVVRQSLVGRATAVMAIVLCLFPWVGLAISVLAVILNFRTTGWTRKLSLIAVVIAALVTIAISILLAFDTK